jgi:hypothetical protein
MKKTCCTIGQQKTWAIERKKAGCRCDIVGRGGTINVLSC